jgi:hypothetical protein
LPGVLGYLLVEGDTMKIACLPRTFVVLILCLVLAVPATSQSGGGHIGPSNGEIVGILVGAGAAIAVVAVVIYHKKHAHRTIVGCVSPGANGFTLMNNKDNQVYPLSGDTGSLKANERVALKGKKLKDSNGKPTFQVEALAKDYGSCHL